MTRQRFVAVTVLALALAALAASIAWAVSRDDGRHMRSTPHGGWMMGYQPGGSTARVHSLADARQRAQAFASRLGLKVGEVMQFQRNYYAKLVDSHGSGATEVLVDPQTGSVSLEYGPAMMWNTRYGVRGHGRAGMMGGGMMGGGAGTAERYGGMMGAPRATGSGRAVSLAQARTVAQRWLDANRPGIHVESGGDGFPGYYTFETLRDGRIDGMISVNASTGAVWSHWWHGAFVAE